MSSARKLADTDYEPIYNRLYTMHAKLLAGKRKAIYKYWSVERAIEAIFEFEHAYMYRGYLVIYNIASPWYAEEDTLLLEEILVLGIAVSGDTKFEVVPEFLMERAREAGCKLAVVGTALAKSDAALASLYIRAGFTAETITLTKEP